MDGGTKKLTACSIIWDTDGDEELAASLPKEIPIPDGMEDLDRISDYISETAGFCHMGFGLSTCKEGDCVCRQK